MKTIAFYIILSLACYLWTTDFTLTWLSVGIFAFVHIMLNSVREGDIPLNEGEEF